MAVTTMDTHVAALQAPGILWPLHKGSFTPQSAAGYTSLWTIAGTPGAGAAPSSGVAGDIPTSATAGSIPFTNSNASYLGLYYVNATQAGTLFLYDRLWQNSGLSTTSTAGQTVQASTPVVPLTRPDANGGQAEAWWDIYTVMGAGTPTSITITYTDQDGNLTQTGTLTGFAATAAAARAFRFGLAAGDTGVRSIQTYTAQASMTSGAMGLVIRRRIAQIGIAVASSGQGLDGIRAGLPRIQDSACLEFVWQGAASATVIDGDLLIEQG